VAGWRGGVVVGVGVGAVVVVVVVVVFVFVVEVGVGRMNEQQSKAQADSVEALRHAAMRTIGKLTDASQNLSEQLVKVTEQRDRLAMMLLKLIDLKHYKENYGKDDFYNLNQPLAWVEARALIEKLK